MKGYLPDIARKGDLEGVLALLGEGADLNSRDWLGFTALLWAANGGHTAIVSALLDHGADIHARSKHGKTALMCAAQHNCLDTVALLLARGAEVNATDESGTTALHWADGDHGPEVRRLLLQAGADESLRPHDLTPDRGIPRPLDREYRAKLEKALADLQHHEAQVREWAVHQLRGIGAPEATGGLRNALEDADARVRGSAALSLAILDVAERRQAVLSLLRTDISPMVRLLCVVSLMSLRGPDIVTALLEALGDPFERVVDHACLALGRMGDATAVGPLLGMLDHPSWYVRFHACEALVRLKAVEERVVAVLEQLEMEPEAVEHDRIVQSANKVNRSFEEEALTTTALLQEARRIARANRH